MATAEKPADAAPAKPAGTTDEKPKADTTTTEEKPKADATTDDKKPDDAKPEPERTDGDKPKAPEKYELAIADDGKVYLDADDLKQFETVARKLGLTNDQAQAEIDARIDALAEQSATFRVQTEADPIYGGDKLAETQRLADLALNKVRPAGTPAGDALRTLLAKTGYGNNLQVVSLLTDLGKMMDEDSPARGGSAGRPPQDAAEVLYGHTMGKASA